FFVGGARVTAADVVPLVDAGECLVLADASGVVGCIHVSTTGGQGYFGMLAVAPGRQGQGLGRRLIAEAEARARTAGCTTMRIMVVNLRTDLLAFYERLGYTPTATEPYTHRRVLQPCHFVVMEKSLR